MWDEMSFYLQEEQRASSPHAVALRLWSLCRSTLDDLQMSSVFPFFEERNQDVDSDSDMSTAEAGSDVSTP